MPYANPQYLVETNWLEQHLQSGLEVIRRDDLGGGLGAQQEGGESG